MSRISLTKPSKLLAEVATFLEQFKNSGQNFACFGHANGENEICLGRPPHHLEPRTLFILDSSYNPPSRAHFALACAALASRTARESAKPHGLLLLFSTANADKAPQPASFEQRLAMMSCLALDIQQALSEEGLGDVNLAIGVTTQPYYVGKSQAIESDPETYPGMPKHVHILGYDTVTRLLASKYYQEYHPPLSALEPYFDSGHDLLVALRPASSSANLGATGSQAVEQQMAFLDGLSKGILEGEGFKSQWAGRISLMDGDDLQAVVGISSTTIRDAVRCGDISLLDQLCTSNVAAWVRKQGLYAVEPEARA